ncbi:MAG: transaldolase family protein [Chloroflexota bacterium]|nr:transaldolase [Dehalococcoidia bacterium]MDW8254253.1 transaldolase family protein [Chloroflexota bacterium]
MLLLDSANPEEARRAATLGYVHGATTNPLLIARSGMSGRAVIEALLAALPGPVFYQPVADRVDAMVAEGRHILALAPDRVVLKLPCTPAGLAAGAALRNHAIFSVTAVFTPAQAIVAAAVGARYIIPYLSRLNRAAGNGAAVIEQMAAVAGEADLLVASLKSVDEAVRARRAGARHLTLPLSLLEEMAVSPLTELVVEEFRRAGARVDEAAAR